VRARQCASVNARKHAFVRSTHKIILKKMQNNQMSQIIMSALSFDKRKELENEILIRLGKIRSWKTLIVRQTQQIIEVVEKISQTSLERLEKMSVRYINLLCEREYFEDLEVKKILKTALILSARLKENSLGNYESHNFYQEIRKYSVEKKKAKLYGNVSHTFINNNFIYSVAFSPNCKFLASGSSDKTIKFGISQKNVRSLHLMDTLMLFVQ
jgi:WD40 repeat protein